MPALGDEIKVEEGKDSYTYYASVSRDGFDFKVGDCCYLMPSSYDFGVKPAPPKKIKVDKTAVR
jgi:hypothetical protein